MFERIKAAARAFTKESRSWQAILSLGYHGPQWMNANYEAFAREGYKWNADVYACVNVTVRSLRGVQFGVYKSTGAGHKLITKGPLFELLKYPNPRQSWSALVGEWAGCMEISGNSYMEGVSPDGPDVDVLKRPPKELYILRPDRMFVVPGNAKIPIAGYEYRAGSVVVPYRVQLWRNPRTGGFSPRSPILHSKYWNPTDDFYGLSPVECAARNIDAYNSAVNWNVALTQNVGRPSGIFRTDDSTLDPQQAEEYTNFIRQKFSGPGNAGRPMVLGKGLTWEQLGLNPNEMDWLDGLEWNGTKICAVYGIPPEIIGDAAHRTYSNYEEARKSVWMEKWLPMLDMFCDDVNAWLSPLYSEEYGEEVHIGYDRDAIEAIQEDRQIKWQNAQKGQNFLTINEQRELLGYAPIPEGDVVMVPNTFVPLNVAGAQTEMPKAITSGSTPAQPDDDEKPKPKPQASKPVKPKPGRTIKPARGRKVSVELLEPKLLTTGNMDGVLEEIEHMRAKLNQISAN